MVDSRFLQANERTLLAWIRTGVGLAAFGFAVSKSNVLLQALSPDEAAAHPMAPAVGVALVLIGVMSMVVGLLRYHRVRASILAGEPGPDSAVAVTSFSVVIILAALALAVYPFFA